MKKGIDFEGARRRRNNEGIKLRKNRRLEGLQKRRAIRVSVSSSTLEADQDETDAMKTDDQEVKLPQFLLETNLTISDSVVQLLMKSNFVDNASTPTSTSTSTSTSSAVYHMVTKSGTGINTKGLVVQSGIVPLLVKNLLSERQDIREQSAICLGNISGESHELRDHVIQCGVINPL